MVDESGIVVDGLSTWYGDKPVLKDVSAAFADNAVTAIIGPSGCGKSTLLWSLNRMTDTVQNFRCEGIIRYNGDSVHAPTVDVTELRTEVGLVFQKPNPFPFSIFDNVAFGPKLHGVTDSAALSRRVRDSLVEADLWSEVSDRLSHSALRLSGGQQQRLCIARALAVRPKVLLLDEPCSALDPRATEKIEALIGKLKKNHGVVIVTHNLAQARRVSDFTLYLLDGHVVEFGKTRDVFESPAEKLTRDYIEGRYG